MDLNQVIEVLLTEKSIFVELRGYEPDSVCLSNDIKNLFIGVKTDPNGRILIGGMEIKFSSFFEQYKFIIYKRMDMSIKYKVLF